MKEVEERVGKGNSREDRAEEEEGVNRESGNCLMTWWETEGGSGSSDWPKSYRIDQATINRLGAQVAKAHEETRQQEEELKREGKLSMDPLLSRVDQRKNLPSTQRETDFYKSTVKDE